MVGAGDNKNKAMERKLSFAEKLKRKLSSNSNQEEEKTYEEEEYLCKFVDVNVASHCLKIMVLILDEVIDKIPRQFIEDLIEFHSS